MEEERSRKFEFLIEHLDRCNNNMYFILIRYMI